MRLQSAVFSLEDEVVALGGCSDDESVIYKSLPKWLDRNDVASDTEILCYGKQESF